MPFWLHQCVAINYQNTTLTRVAQLLNLQQKQGMCLLLLFFVFLICILSVYVLYIAFEPT